MGFKSPRSQASRRSGFTFSRLATGSGGYPLSCRAQVSTVGLTSAGVEVLIFKIYPIPSALGNSRKNQDLGSNLHGLLTGIYLFHENWSTETFRGKKSKKWAICYTRSLSYLQELTISGRNVHRKGRAISDICPLMGDPIFYSCQVGSKNYWLKDFKRAPRGTFESAQGDVRAGRAQRS